MDEPVKAPAAEDLTAIAVANSNVRTGPSTDHAVAYRLTSGSKVTVVRRNEEGTRLQIEHEDRPGRSVATLTDIADEVAELPAD